MAEVAVAVGDGVCVEVAVGEGVREGATTIGGVGEGRGRAGRGSSQALSKKSKTRKEAILFTQPTRKRRSGQEQGEVFIDATPIACGAG
jgi:hypothetical protein